MVTSIFKIANLIFLANALIISNSACKKAEEEEEEDETSAEETTTSTEKAASDSDDDESLPISQIDGTDYHRTSSSTPLAQSFLVDDAFSLTQVSIYVSNRNGVVAGSINVIITKSGADPAAGTRVSEWVTVVSTHAISEVGWVDFEFETAVELEADTLYWIEIWPDPSEPFDLMEDASGPYDDGQMLRMDSITSNWLSSQESGQPVLGDIKFKLYAE